ncbi:copper amine oxidase [Pseudoflavonifractor sp. 524-17]|uniref:cell wall hydrolase n=1 Tax=Pseudoflavonifractor sp. 524-17 TaxID=2304577 RepID=UPI00137985E7|nr:cell wall hydrolase [Pseudoflavonifractor sp. 524-17]NCE64556.1 copper amine oxidase [Pseudoflavonifractor sp. 524-17]
MQKRVSCLVLSLALGLSLSAHAAAAESSIGVIVDETELAPTTITRAVECSTYVAYWPVVSAMYPDATAVWENGEAVVRAEGLTLHIRPGAQYLVANGRYLYVPEEIQIEEQSILVPARVLAQALGAQVYWDGETQTVSFVSDTGPIPSDEATYNSEDLYWLSRIISAESGNQSLEGKIAVGNVVLNRVANSKFPNTVKDVIFQKNQFTPAGSGAINQEPNAESVIAAKLCLEGVNTAGNSLYFINPNTSPNSWASRNRVRVATIGSHAFFA